MIKRLVVAVAAFVVSAPFVQAHGSDASGVLIGASGVLNRPTVDPSEIQDGSVTSVNADDSDFGFRVFAGYDFNEHFAIEAGYSDFGESSISGESDGSGFFWSSGSVLAVAEGEGFDVGLVIKLPIYAGVRPKSSAASVFLRLGALFWSTEVTLTDSSGSAQGEDDANDLVAGAGLEYNGLAPVRIRAEVARYVLDESEVDTASLSLIFLFGR